MVCGSLIKLVEAELVSEGLEELHPSACPSVSGSFRNTTAPSKASHPAVSTDVHVAGGYVLAPK